MEILLLIAIGVIIWLVVKVIRKPKTVTKTVTKVVKEPVYIKISSKSERESYFRDKWAEKVNGQIEAKFKGGSVDVLTDDIAYEIEFEKSWMLGLGQSLYYGASLNKQPGIVLVNNTDNNMPYYNRLVDTVNHYDLPVIIESMNYTDYPILKRSK